MRITGRAGKAAAKGRWGLPGGFIDIENDDSTRTTALRKLTEKTGVSPSWLEQLDTFSGPNRDPRGWSLTVTWFALIAWVDCAPHIASVSNARWVPVDELKNYSLAFDHEKIITAALHRLRQKRCTRSCQCTACQKHLPMGNYSKPLR